MEFVKKTIKVGNSAGVLLPKKLLGSQVKITVVDRPINIKKLALKLLAPDFKDILGIYAISKDPIEVLAISTKIKKLIEKNKIKLSIVPLSMLKRDLKIKPVLRSKISKAHTILNHSLLSELRKKLKITKEYDASIAKLIRDQKQKSEIKIQQKNQNQEIELEEK